MIAEIVKVTMDNILMIFMKNSAPDLFNYMSDGGENREHEYDFNVNFC